MTIKAVAAAFASMALAGSVHAQGTAPDGDYACEYLASGNMFIPIGTVTARRGQLSYRGRQPDSWKIEQVVYGGPIGPDGQPLVWVRYRNTVGISSDMRCLPKK